VGALIWGVVCGLVVVSLDFIVFWGRFFCDFFWWVLGFLVGFGFVEWLVRLVICVCGREVGFGVYWFFWGFLWGASYVCYDWGLLWCIVGGFFDGCCGGLYVGGMRWGLGDGGLWFCLGFVDWCFVCCGL